MISCKDLLSIFQEITQKTQELKMKWWLMIHDSNQVMFSSITKKWLPCTCNSIKQWLLHVDSLHLDDLILFVQASYTHMAYLTIEGAILSHFQWFLHKNWDLKNKTWVGSHVFFFYGYIPWKYKLQNQNMLQKYYIFLNIHLFSLQTLLFWWTGIGHQNVTLAIKMSNFGQLLVKVFDYVIDILCILTQ